MKYLAIIRHGLTDKSFESLTRLGYQQASYLAKLLGRLIKKYSSVQILVSPTNRTTQSAKPLVEIFHAPAIGADELYNESDLPAIVRLIQDQAAELVILVTHQPILQDLPKLLNIDLEESFPTGYSEGLLIKLEDGQTTLTNLSWKHQLDFETQT